MSTSLNFVEVENHDTGEHQFRVLELDLHPEQLNGLANEYVKLRTQCNFPLTEIHLDGITVLDPKNLRERIRRATLPIKREGNFDVVRSDFGETLCYLVLEQAYGTKFGYKGVRDRELIDLPGRGIDAVGIEYQGIITLVLSEVKVSDENTSPPRVVDDNDDSLRNQHLAHMGEMEKTERKIWDLARKAPDATIQELFLIAANYFEFRRWDKLKLIACCTLIRPKDRYNQTDFGTFINSPEHFSPARVRYLIICVPDRVKTIVDSWYAAANHLEVTE